MSSPVNKVKITRKAYRIEDKIKVLDILEEFG
jgi:hypothetical protein